MQFTTDQRKPWYIQALRPDGSPLTFGYDVLDLQENNIGVVGQGSRLFIRVDEIPTGIKVALNDEDNLFCTITFQHVIDENKTYNMPVKGVLLAITTLFSIPMKEVIRSSIYSPAYIWK